MWGVTLFRPPCKLGSSLVLTLAVDAYRSWNLEGRGGRSERASSRLRFNVDVVDVVAAAAAVAAATVGVISSSSSGSEEEA